jgi:hypothetical protein
MKSQGGFLTTDFLFALILTMGMSAVVFGITYSLVAFQSAQYMVFAASRAHAAGHVSVQEQVSAARTKYGQLLNDGALSVMFNGGWFAISTPEQLDIRSGGDRNFNQDYPSTFPLQQGVRANLTAELLNMNLPFIGQISNVDDDGFNVRVVSLLIRETSMDECIKYQEDRVNAIWTMRGTQWSSFQGGAIIDTPWEDNGC